MKSGLLATDEIPELGITVMTIVEYSYIVTAIERWGGPAESDRPIISVKIAIIEGLRTTADPRLQHDAAVQDARAGLYSERAADIVREHRLGRVVYKLRPFSQPNDSSACPPATA